MSRHPDLGLLCVLTWEVCRFTRIYEAGHEVPAYQPKAALALFYRALKGLRSSDGAAKVNATSGSKGEASATHTET